MRGPRPRAAAHPRGRGVHDRAGASSRCACALIASSSARYAAPRRWISIKVWGTGHPGGIATIHAGSALGALLRLEQLILEVAVNPPRALIAEAVNVVIHIAGRGRKRRIESIARVVGFDGAGYHLADALETPFPELLPVLSQPLPLRLPRPLTYLENCHDADDTFLLSVFP